MLKKYILILFGLMIVLAVNCYYHFNSSYFKNSILNTMTYQFFKDSKNFKNLPNNEREKLVAIISKYVESVLHESFNKRNDFIKLMIGSNIVAILIVCGIGVLHYLFYIINTNNRNIIFRISIVASSVWLLIIFYNYNFIERIQRFDNFLVIGLIPPILLNGLFWIKSAQLQSNKQVEQNN